MRCARERHDVTQGRVHGNDLPAARPVDGRAADAGAVLASCARFRRLIGVDFSAAADAGRRTWVAHAHRDGARISLDDCYAIEKLDSRARDRDAALATLRRLLAGQSGVLTGFDFPAGLPLPLVGARTWLGFLRRFVRRFSGPEQFRSACRSAADGRDLKRVTDRENRTPFSAYNLRLYRQTYYGIRDVLAPLVLDGAARVVPMQPPEAAGVTLVEICPASYLKRERLYRPYKGPTPELRLARSTILAALINRQYLATPPRRLRDIILRDSGGDALDSVLAALCAARAAHCDLRPAREAVEYTLEGYVYC